jgi:rhamnose utilization protein RhaD (predicted bifunctional aldolase and dehydrogenase)/NAD(P)-dependent dehydrogenase (short-subunit alcohol dehydrogenase family)
MKSLWSDAEAKEFVERYGEKGTGADLALRVYTTRLLGKNPKLVLHGGGNSSVKTRMKDLLGDTLDVICVKGSGWDMGNIEPAGLPAVKVEPLRRLRALDRLSDEDMVNFQRLNLLDASAPNPSVETLLHAFLPHKFVDHTHSTAVLALTNQPDGEAVAREVFGDRMGYVPYCIPGFTLAKKAAEIHDASPSVRGLILVRHGIFTFADSARGAYELMVEMASLAEERIRRGTKTIVEAKLPEKIATVTEVAPILRGSSTISHNRKEGVAKRQILCFRTSPAILEYVNGAAVARYSQIGVVTPDHTIRTKNWPLLVPPPEVAKLDEWTTAARRAVDEFVARYDAYFQRNNARVGNMKKELDPLPRVILVPGLGLYGLGATANDAAIAADVAENTVEVIRDAESMTQYQSIPESDQFDVEYWSLEQAKLSKATEKPLSRQIAVITGGGSGIGAAAAKAMAKQGAEVAILDRDGDASQRVAKELGRFALAITCDVTSPDDVKRAFDTVVRAFGGVDIVVSNAGGAWQGSIAEVLDGVLRQSFELNFFAHQSVAQNAVRIMKAQGTGGCLLFNASKQAVNPGKDFGPYGLPKAATLSLMKQYAVDHGKDGIRSNAVNADRIRTGLLTDEMVAQRAKARGVSEQDYMSGNLLGREVTVEDVADAFVFLALAQKTTGATVTVDGGNIEASLR